MSRGAIRRVSLVEACSLGLAGTVEFLIDDDSTDLDACGLDGMSPLCVAATWGYVEIVRKLLDAGCDPNVRNEDTTASTALHAASCQEHGPIIHLLLQAGADAMVQDGDGRTPCDFASVSDSLWPLFAARGYTRTPKDVLVVKRVIYKIDPASDVADPTADDAAKGGDGGTSALPFYSRPGSAYARSEPARSDGVGASAGAARLPGLPEHDGGGGIDPLELAADAGDDDDDDERREQPGLSIGALWREGF